MTKYHITTTTTIEDARDVVGAGEVTLVDVGAADASVSLRLDPSLESDPPS